MTTQRTFLLAGMLVLAAAWLGPLPQWSGTSFAAHMGLHLALIAIAAPLLALGFSGTRVEAALAGTILLSPLLASLAELVIVWAWHFPAFHAAAKASTSVFVLEQASFLVIGTLLWLSVLGRLGAERERAGIGIIALLLTSMHMTLLGALLTFAGRPLYAHGHDGHMVHTLADQQLGGALMLGVGGTVYLLGGLYLLLRLLGREPEEARRTGWAGTP